MGDKMRRQKKDAVLFMFGGVGYGLLEIVWRGHTHWTMMVAGGICFLLFSRIDRQFCRRSLLTRAVLGAGCVTAVEFLFGLIFNLGYGMAIWDYSGMPMNLLGQICLPYALLWGGLSMGMVPLAGRVARILDGKNAAEADFFGKRKDERDENYQRTGGFEGEDSPV